MQAIHGQTVLFAPALARLQNNGTRVLIDAERPHWLATDARGERLVSLFDGRRNLDDVVALYGSSFGLEPDKAWMHVHSFALDAVREGVLRREPPAPRPYAGRAAALELDRLQELWVHANNSCNLTCAHCLVSSGPDGDRGVEPEVLRGWVDQGLALGVKRVYITGGEPFLRKDMLDLIEAILAHDGTEVCVLTNGMLFTDDRLARLTALPADRFRVQISLDGSTPEQNDPCRGEGSFEKITAGIRKAAEAGLAVTVSTVVMAANEEDVPAVTRLVAELGVSNHHLLWLHHRGRADEQDGLDLAPERVLEVVRKVRAVGQELGITVDNDVSVEQRLKARAGTRHDLSNMGWESLCIYADGTVYPSAALAGEAELACGRLQDASLETIWRESAVLEDLRGVSLMEKPVCRDCSLRFLCGGGDLEHAWHASPAQMKRHSFRAHDPYCELHKGLIADAFDRLVGERRALTNGRHGFDATRVERVMGQGAVLCGDYEVDAALEPGVRLRHSECVLSYDLDAARKVVREFYGEAAEEPQEELCCPTSYDVADTEHIPQAVLDRFYGCGSPVARCGLEEGETYLDLGSGAGIDVFIAAKKVGATGKAIGVDMTDEMLAVANESRAPVADSLGFDVADFRKGYLEDIPVDERSVDCVTSNCVINLSPDKERVLNNIWRVLKDNGRAVISDIVADREVPPHQKVDGRLWGECLSGALSEDAFLSLLRRAGFYGVEVLRRAPWRSVEDVTYLTLTVRAWKFEKKAGCVFVGQQATYLGPFEAVVDEEGHRFPRGVPVEVCTDTAAKLGAAPYASHFLVSDATQPIPAMENGCVPGEACC
ncbi:MAG: methyltransferase domain-containing protein [Planctomycetota bacterium]|nr:methyltransferase domain-containing protein [Planctomycetota bacterium]